MKVLLVKTSSMGDLVHTLPALTDIANHFPHAQLHWLAEDAFVKIASMHPGVKKTHSCAMRTWRRSLFNAETWKQICAHRKKLAQEKYDCIIDFQGLVKSAVLARLAGDTVHGYNYASVREKPASLLYKYRYHIGKNMHAVERNRQLAAQTFGYSTTNNVNWGIARQSNTAEKTVVFLHATSRAKKMYPCRLWSQMACEYIASGYCVILPWYSIHERRQAEEIADKKRGARVLQVQSIAQMLPILAQSRLVIAVDTGFAHLANAMGKPTCILFFTSSPALTGALGSSALNIISPRAQLAQTIGTSNLQIARLNMEDTHAVAQLADTLTND